MILATILFSLHKPLETIVIVVYPLCALLVGVALLFGPGPEGAGRHYPVGLLAHISFSLLSYSTLAIAFAQAALILTQIQLLKHHQAKGLFNALPSLQLMEEILFGLIWIGVILLTFSILSGMLFVEDFLGQQLVHKTFFTLLAWLIFSALLLGRHLFGWRGQTAVHWSISGFVLMMIGFLGTKFVIEILLKA